jgi:tRNA G46 methylase TrmB
LAERSDGSGRSWCCWLVCAGRAQAGSAAPSAQRETSNPYTGDLSIFDAPGRDERLQINRVMDMLGIQPGKIVADIGAGSGWFTVRAARRVTDSGTVYAVDINREAIHHIDKRTKKEQLKNVKTIINKPDDPQIQPTASTPCCCSRPTTK